MSNSDTAYRGLNCNYSATPIPLRQFDWLATDPNGEGEVLAEGATIEELRADIDRYFEELEPPTPNRQRNKL